jgi:macrolide-specific efflux system membrane fusion protein
MRLRAGMAAYFTTLGNAERRWEGKVRQILPAPEVLNDVVLYHVLIDVENEGHQLMTGMTTQVFFLFGKAENAPLIPAEALNQREPAEDNQNGKAYRVRVLTKSGPEERLIHVGLQTRTQAEVKEGLQEGEQLLVKRSAASPAQNNSAQRGGMRRFMGGPRL